MHACIKKSVCLITHRGRRPLSKRHIKSRKKVHCTSNVRNTRSHMHTSISYDNSARQTIKTIKTIKLQGTPQNGLTRNSRAATRPTQITQITQIKVTTTTTHHEIPTANRRRNRLLPLSNLLRRPSKNLPSRQPNNHPPPRLGRDNPPPLSSITFVRVVPRSRRRRTSGRRKPKTKSPLDPTRPRRRLPPPLGVSRRGRRLKHRLDNSARASERDARGDGLGDEEGCFDAGLRG